MLEITAEEEGRLLYHRQSDGMVCEMKRGITFVVLAILTVVLLSAPAYANVISATQADGLIVYQTLNNQTPLYRLWNVSNNFTTVRANSLNTGADINWVVVRANHERDEIIMGIEDQANDVNIQVYNATAATWGALLEVSSDVPNSAHRAFDVAVEDVSGDALIVYENSSLDTNHGLAYRIWNGTSYSDELPLDSTLADSSIHWVQSTPRKGGDEIMVLLHNNVGDLHAALWNGTGFDTTRNITLSTSTTSNAEPHFAFAWEGASDDGLVVYGSGNDLVYRSFSLTAPYWSTETTIALGNGLSAARLCSEEDSDFVGMIWIDAGNDVNARMWDGTQILASPPSEDAATEATGSNNANVDCAWLNSTSALFGFSDVSVGTTGLLSMDYFNFTRPNTWSVSDLTTVPTTVTFASDDIEGLRFAEHPTTNEIMVVAMDITESISLLRWNGTGFASVGESPIETGTEVANGAQEGTMFGWNQYDSSPNVTLVNPNGQNFDEAATVDINATVRENVLVRSVLANITLPNGTIKQVTLANRTGNATHFNISFSVTGLNGIYTVRIIANDTSTHRNVNSTETTTFGIGDYVAPNATDVTPLNNATFEFQARFEIAVNVTDGSNISIVLANVTLPNGSIRQLTLLNQTALNATSKHNTTFNVTDLHGAYHLRIIANDTKNNVNSSQFTTFIVGDVLVPNVTNVTPLAGTDFELNSLINITVNVSDNANVSRVVANVTLPNGSISQLTLLNSTRVHYNATFSVTSLEGTYTIRIVANDSANNVNSSVNTTFTMGDTVAPNVTINAPANNTNFSITSLLFNFTATDAGYATLNCSILINDTVNKTNTNVGGSQLTTFEITGFLDRDYNWTVSCNDTAAHVNTSVVRYFTVDTASPQFNSLTTVPSLEPNLDPNLNISVYANITDNTTAVGTVIFQYKLSNDTAYRNITMMYNTGDSLYNASFNATQNGTYNLRIWANDSVGNLNESAVTNILVQFDRNWTRAPAQLAAVRTSLNRNVSLGNITINNTGDYAVQFNISSDSAKTYFNESSNFAVLANSVKQIEILDNGTVAGVKSITLNITTNDTLAFPSSQTTTASIVVAEGQPVFVSRFTTPSTGALSVTQGDTAVEFVATTENIGEGNATNVVFHFRIPDAWTVTFGELSRSAAEFNSGEKETRTIRVTIPSTFAAGDYVVFANATGVNGSGYNISTINLTFGDTLLVTVNALAALGGGGSSSASSSTSSSSTSTTTTTAGGSAGGEVAKKAFGDVTETIESTEVFSVVRGLGEATPISIANLYEHALMENIELAVVGFLGQYVVVSPPVELSGITSLQLVPGKTELFPVAADGKMHQLTVDELFESTAKVTVESEPQQLTLTKGKSRFADVNGDGFGDIALHLVEGGGKADVRVYQVRDMSRTTLGYGEQLEYFLDIIAPSYLTRADFELELMITADVVAINETAAGFARKAITEFRKLLFQVREVGEEDVRTDIGSAQQVIQALVDAGFSVVGVKALLEQAEQAIAEGNYELAAEYIERIQEMKDEAFAAHDAILEAQAQIERAKEKWLSIPQTEEALELARVAFERGDFSTALERARAAQLQYVLETKGRVNLVWLIVHYWWALIMGAIVALVLLYYGYKYSIVAIVNQRIHNLNKEEDTITELIKEAQKKYLVDKSLSVGQYKRYLSNYEKRLTKIQQLRVKLRSMRVAILKAEQGLENIQREKKEIQELLHKNQLDYFVKGAISRSRFTYVYNENKARLAEIEHEEAVLEERLSKESGTARYSLLRMVRSVVEWFGQLFRSKELHFGKRKPLPVSVHVQRALKEHLSSVQESVPRVAHALHTVVMPKKSGKEWVPIKASESAKLNAHCEKTGLELPRKQVQRRDVFAAQSREAFDTELLRMLGTVEQEPGKEMTYLESLSLPRRPKRLTEAELRKWYPGAFEIMPRQSYSLGFHMPIQQKINEANEILNLSDAVTKYPFSAELMEMLQSNVEVKKEERRKFIDTLDYDLLNLVKAENKLTYAEGNQFLKGFDKGLLGMLKVKR